MSNLLSLSRPYAEAVFALATDSNKTTEWQTLLNNLAIIMADGQMQELISSPKITVQNLSKIFHNILNISDKQQLQFVDMLLANKRMTLVTNILQHYINLSNVTNNVQPATIISAHALNNKQQQDIIKALTTKTGAEIHASFTIDKNIIGGLIIKVNDKVIDKSVSGMLTQVSNQITQTKDISYAT
jgi:F-type H+-transporting ATPase subunit delta